MDWGGIVQSRTDKCNTNLEEAKEQIKTLECKLNDAHHEISRLNSEFAQSPAHKVLDCMCDAKIKLLEKEKEDLQECLDDDQSIRG